MLTEGAVGRNGALTIRTGPTSRETCTGGEEVGQELFSDFTFVHVRSMWQPLKTVNLFLEFFYLLNH